MQLCTTDGIILPEQEVNFSPLANSSETLIFQSKDAHGPLVTGQEWQPSTPWSVGRSSMAWQKGSFGC